MAEPETLPAPVVDLSPPAETKWQREYRAYLRMLPELLSTHADKYVAVHEEKVVDQGDDKVALALRVYERFGYVPIYVGLVTATPAVERIPYRRPVRE